MTSPRQFDYVRDEGAETIRVTSEALFPKGLRAAEVLPANRFVDDSFSLASIAAVDVIGATVLASNQYDSIVAASAGVRMVYADQQILANSSIKVGDSGKATVLVTASEIANSLTGVSDDFDQSELAATLDIAQNTDQAADRSLGIVVIGIDANSAPVSETIFLDASDTTQTSTGSTSFTEVVAAYSVGGQLLGDDVTIVANGGSNTIATIAGNSNSVGVAVINSDAYFSAINFVAGNVDTTYVIAEGEISSNLGGSDLEVFDFGNTNSATSNTLYRHISNVYLGGFTDAETADLDFKADNTSAQVGISLADAPEGGLVPIFFQPNFYSVATA